MPAASFLCEADENAFEMTACSLVTRGEVLEVEVEPDAFELVGADAALEAQAAVQRATQAVATMAAVRESRTLGRDRGAGRA